MTTTNFDNTYTGKFFLAFLGVLFPLFLFAQVPTVDGLPCDLALYGPALGADNDNDTPTGTADVDGFWLLQDGDDV